MEPKQDPNLTGKIVNPAVPSPAPRASCGKMWSPNRLSGPIRQHCCRCSLPGLSPGLVLLIPCGFPQAFYIFDISSFMGFQLLFWLHSPNFIDCPLRGTQEELWPLTHFCLPSCVFYWNVGRSFGDPNTCILYFCKTNTTQIMPRLATSLSSCWDSLDHDCCGWTWGYSSLSSPDCLGVPGSLLSKFHNLEPVMGDVLLI